MSPELEAALKVAKEIVAKMTLEEKETMLKAQGESWVRAEASWPKPKFDWINGIKVYRSYKDYCND